MTIQEHEERAKKQREAMKALAKATREAREKAGTLPKKTGK